MKNKKYFLFVVGVVALVSLAVVFIVTYQTYNSSNQKVVEPTNQPAMTKITPTSKAMVDKTIVEPTSGMQIGTYEEYASEKLAKASNGIVVLFFRASWCPTCRTVDADIRNNLNNIPKELTILDVNYDDSTSLKQKYGVTYQHTFVQVKANGDLIKKWSGSPTLQDIINKVN